MSLPKSDFLQKARVEHDQKKFGDLPLTDYFMSLYQRKAEDDSDGKNKAYPDYDKYGEFSDEDLRFIIDNSENFTNDQKKRLWYSLKRNSSMGGTEVGLWYAATKKSKNPLAAQAAFAIVSTIDWSGLTLADHIVNKRPAEKNFPVEFFIENESEILKVAALEDFSFENWDIKTSEIVNKFLDSDPSIDGLNYAQNSALVDKTSGEYAWPPDWKEEYRLPDKTVRVAVDNNLWSDSKENNGMSSRYLTPFSEKRFKNDARLAKGVGFSKFKVSSVLNYSWAPAWSDSRFVTDGQHKWFIFVTELMTTLELSKDTNGKYKFDVIKANELMEDKIREYLEVKSKIQIFQWGASIDTYVEMSLFNLVGKTILDVFREGAWKQFAKDLKDISDEELGRYDTFKGIQDAFKSGAAAANDSEVTMGTPDERDTPLTDKEIEERQRFMKQCALMTNLGELAAEHNSIIKQRIDNKKSTDKDGAYNKRFYMVRDGNGDQHGTLSKILLPKAEEISEFLEMKTEVHAFLVPKLRFFKVYNSEGTLIEEEFHFRNFTSTDRIESLFSSKFDRGGDYGIKEFSFSFEGATPATAKNDITANLSLYFQTFDDFITVQPENKSSFVDMLLLPGNSNTKDTRETTLEYNSEFYRIRVDLGWNIKSTEAIKNLSGINLNKLKTALQKTNKSFYLTMIDHTIDFRDDGSVGIDVQYRAYMETALKSSKLDALADENTRQVMKQVTEEYKKIIDSGKCNVTEENKIRRQLLEIEDLLKRQSFQSIMRRLLERDFLFFKKVTVEAGNTFQKSGFFTKKAILGRGGSSSTPDKSKEKSEKAKKEKATFEFGDDFYNENLSNDQDYNYINYFYLADLVYVVLDSLYESKNPTSYVKGYEKFKFILGSFEFEDSLDDNKPKKTINLGSIPISVEVFFEWFSENVIKSERKSYPIMYFIRDLCTYLIGEILTENCFRTSLDKKLHFKTTNFNGFKDPIAKMKGPFVDVAKYYGETLPLKQDDDKHLPIKDLTNYIMIYVDTPKVSRPLGLRRGNKKIDGDNGIYHFQIGKDRGLLKKMKFSKSDMKYVREARFFRHGFDGLMQLSNVYNVSLEMIGNTLYYPGMEVFINPLGFLGAKTKDWDPTRGAPSGNPSVANKLGFGGYHLVTRVKSSIGPGKFTTTVDAMFTYSGDGDANSKLTGPKGKKPKDITEREAFKPDSKCVAIYNQVVSRALDIQAGESTWDPIDFSPGSTTPDESTPAEPATESAVSSPEEQSTVETAKELLNPNSNSNTGIVTTSLLKTYSPNSTSSSQATSAYDKTDPNGKRYTVLAGVRFYEDGSTTDDQQANALEALNGRSTP